MVKNVKQLLKKESPDSRMKIKDTITTFLRTYRNTPHSITNKTPAELILKQLPCTRLALTSPNITTRVKVQLQSNTKQPQAETRKFSVDDPVLV